MVDKIFDCRERSNNTLVACNNAVLERNVEVAAYKNLLAVYVNILNSLFVKSFHY